MSNAIKNEQLTGRYGFVIRCSSEAFDEDLHLDNFLIRLYELIDKFKSSDRFDIMADPNEDHITVVGPETETLMLEDFVTHTYFEPTDVVDYFVNPFRW